MFIGAGPVAHGPVAVRRDSYEYALSPSAEPQCIQTRRRALNRNLLLIAITAIAIIGIDVCLLLLCTGPRAGEGLKKVSSSEPPIAC